MARLAHRQCDRQTNKKQKRWQCARRKAKNKHAKTKAKQQQNKCVRVFWVCVCVCELPKSMHAARNSSRTQTRRGEGGAKGARRRLQCCKCQLELTELHAEHTQQQQQSHKKEMFRCGATETATTNSSRCRRRQGSMRTSAAVSASFFLLLLLLRLLVAWRRHLTFSWCDDLPRCRCRCHCRCRCSALILLSKRWLRIMDWFERTRRDTSRHVAAAATKCKTLCKYW